VAATVAAAAAGVAAGASLLTVVLQWPPQGSCVALHTQAATLLPAQRHAGAPLLLQRTASCPAPWPAEDWLLLLAACLRLGMPPSWGLHGRPVLLLLLAMSSRLLHISLGDPDCCCCRRRHCCRRCRPYHCLQELDLKQPCEPHSHHGPLGVGPLLLNSMARLG
jgi:hypothetical protein